MNYKNAIELLNGKNRKKLEFQTYLEKRGENVAVLLHETDVILFYPDDKIVLNSGGWKTKMTKDRINNYSPVSISQKNGIWYVIHNGKEVIFKDGITIDGEKITGDGGTNNKILLKTKKEAQKYINNFIEKFKNSEIKIPSRGDCWYCSLKEVESHKPLGDVISDNHILEHIREKYYVPSLFLNAMNENKNQLSIIAQDSIARWLNNDLTGNGILIESQLKRALKLYIFKRIGLTA